MSNENDTPQTEPPVLEPKPYIPNPGPQTRKYYKPAAGYQADNSFTALFGELMELLEPEDLEEIAGTVEMRRRDRRDRLRDTLLEHEQHAGEIEEAEAHTTAVKAYLVGLHPELDKYFAAFDRKAEKASSQGRRRAQTERIRLNDPLRGSGKSEPGADPQPGDQPQEESIFGINF